MALSFRLGGSESRRLVLQPSRPEGEALRYTDDSWYACDVEIDVPPFRASYTASFADGDLRRLRDGLASIYETLTGTVTLDPVEDQLIVRITGNGRGSFVAECEARQDAGLPDHLLVEISFDQTDIPRMIQELNAIVGPPLI